MTGMPGYYSSIPDTFHFISPGSQILFTAQLPATSVTLDKSHHLPLGLIFQEVQDGMEMPGVAQKCILKTVGGLEVDLTWLDPSGVVEDTSKLITTTQSPPLLH